MIYEYSFLNKFHEEIQQWSTDWRDSVYFLGRVETALLQTCRQIRNEGWLIPFAVNVSNSTSSMTGQS